MKIILIKTTKLALKGNKNKKLVPANGEEIEVTDTNGKLLIDSGLAIDPSQKVVAPNQNAEEIESLKEENETLKNSLTEKEEEVTLLNEDVEDKDSEIATLKEENETLKNEAADLLGGDK